MSRFALVFGILGCAQAVAAQEIGGLYTIEGTNFDGSTYGGKAKIVLSTDVACEIAWISGKTTVQGACMRSGTAFSAAYRFGDGVAIVLYQLQPDGTLVGAWTVSGGAGVGVEVLRPQAS